MTKKLVVASLFPAGPPWSAVFSTEFYIGMLEVLERVENTNIPIRYERLDYGMQTAAEAFMNKTSGDVLLLLPHTHKLPVWGIERLMSRDLPIIAPVSWEPETGAPQAYLDAFPESGMMPYALNEVGSRIANQMNGTGDRTSLLDDFDDSLIELPAVRAPLLITREALGDIPTPWFSYSGEYPELNFCLQARKSGVPITLDTSVLCESGGRTAQGFLEIYARTSEEA